MLVFFPLCDYQLCNVFVKTLQRMRLKNKEFLPQQTKDLKVSRKNASELENTLGCLLCYCSDPLVYVFKINLA